jgi:hypothetical protein
MQGFLVQKLSSSIFIFCLLLGKTSFSVIASPTSLCKVGQTSHFKELSEYSDQLLQDYLSHNFLTIAGVTFALLAPSKKLKAARQLLFVASSSVAMAGLNYTAITRTDPYQLKFSKDFKDFLKQDFSEVRTSNVRIIALKLLQEYISPMLHFSEDKIQLTQSAIEKVSVYRQQRVENLQVNFGDLFLHGTDMRNELGDLQNLAKALVYLSQLKDAQCESFLGRDENGL